MVINGNPRQWAAKNWPPESLVREDIRLGRNYVCLCDGIIVGVFVYQPSASVTPPNVMEL